MELDAYKNRIGFHSELQATADCLERLHKHHILTIPFESLDVYLNRHIDLSLDKIFNKVILNNRGGYCYELNFLFQAFLSEIGFECYLITASIFENERFGPEYDHMAIVVKLDDLWLVDVGYGDLFINPLRLLPHVTQKDNAKYYMIKEIGENEYILSESLQEFHDYKVKYKFKNIPCEAHLFEKQNHWKQNSHESYFVKNKICTLPTQHGRLTLFNDTFKVRTRDHVSKKIIASEEEFNNILKKEFNIEITVPL